MKYCKPIMQCICTSLFFVLPLCAQEFIEDDREEEIECVARSINARHTSHSGSKHRYTGHTPFFEQIVLEDGSLWDINPEQRFTVERWLIGDKLAITQPQKGWWNASYEYPLSIVNLRTTERIDVSLRTEPTFDGLYRRWISIIVKNRGDTYLVLNDGTTWPLSESDRDTWEIWIPGDTIVIGTNDSWLQLINPNLLINVSCSSTYIVGKCQKL